MGPFWKSFSNAVSCGAGAGADEVSELDALSPEVAGATAPDELFSSFPPQLLRQRAALTNRQAQNSFFFNHITP